ncbi:MAG: serpin family protein [Terriglobia bacterium]
MGILRKIVQLFSTHANEVPASREPEPVVEAELEAVEGETDLAAVVRGNGAFALDLYSRLSSCSGNLFFSPFSISAAVAMTYGGAQGATAEEMAAALHFPFGQERLHPAFANLLNQIKGKSRGVELSLANGLWAQRGYEFRESFKDLVKTHYGAELSELDFSTATEEARRTINDWVERQTAGKIRDLIGPGALGPLTRLVLANAIYFKGDWASPFQKERTKDAPFTVTPKQKVTVPMMCQSEEYGYLETDGFQALGLAYEGWDLTMAVFLPRKVDGLPELEKSLTPRKLRTWLAGLRPRVVTAYFPRFRATSAFTLNGVLAEMGMRLAFEESAADFSGMTSWERLYLSLVLHKAYVDVDEKGTEAAAATAVLATGAAFRPLEVPIPVFRADHPFLFLVVDHRSGSILFLGRVTNPKE